MRAKTKILSKMEGKVEQTETKRKKLEMSLIDMKKAYEILLVFYQAFNHFQRNS